jgi:hypothetical protein
MILSIKQNRFQTFGTVSVTGTGNETILSSLVVPGGSFTSGDFLYLDTMVSFTPNLSTGATIKFYSVAGTSATLGGAIRLSTLTLSFTDQFAGHQRRLYIRTANGTGTGITLGTEVYSTTTNAGSEFFSSLTSNVAIDWTSDTTIFLSGQLDNTGSTLRSYYLKIWEY